MNKNRRLEHAYRKLQNGQTPDLWNRIESRLEMEEHKPEKAPETRNQAGEQQELYKPSKRAVFWRLIPYSAAALVTLAALSGVILKNGDLGRRSAEGTAGTFIHDETFYANETAQADKNLGWMGDQEGGAQGVVDGLHAVWYEELAVTGTEPERLPGDAVYASGDDFYFTEEAVGNSDLLCQASVEKVSYEKGADGQSWEAVYEITVDKTLYFDGVIEEALKLNVRSPLIKSEDASPMYLLKEGGCYVLPLTFEYGVWQITVPYAPQIEVTADNGYIFHTGWRSLLDDQTVVVMKKQQALNDYYFDRMVYRNDEEFLSNLTVLVEALHRNRNHG